MQLWQVSMALGLIGMLAIQAPAQPEAATTRPTRPHNKEASKLIKLLELPNKKSEAVQGLLKLGEDAAPDLGRALSDPRPDMVLTIVQLLKMLGGAGKAALPDLEKLARSKDRQMAYAARWAMTAARSSGVIVVAASGNSALVHLDKDGKETKRLARQQNIFDAEKLANGNYMICLYTKKLVQEITPKGKVVWEYAKNGTPMDVDRLPDGNTLIADIQKGVFEVDRKGKIVWQYKAKSPYEADRLPNGNTLISEFGGGRVIEVDPKGKVIWTLKARNPMDVDLLPDGNLLVAEFSGSVRLVDRKGKDIRTYSVRSSYSVDMLPNGDVLVGAQGGVYCFSKEGKQKWFRALSTVGSVEHY